MVQTLVARERSGGIPAVTQRLEELLVVQPEALLG
jgi:hypothetical protein